MNTRVIKIDIRKIDHKKIKLAAQTLRQGGLVAFPTETVYGLGANALNAKAVKGIFEAKGRPLDNPIIVHVADKKGVLSLTKDIPTEAVLLMESFWPGPLTMILKKSGIVPDIVTAGLDTVAIRMPSHPVAFSLIKEANVPVAGPSANLAGKPSTTKAEHVINDLNGKIDVILDVGETDIGVESTVIDLTSPRPTLLRPGGTTLEDLEKILGEIRIDPFVKGKTFKGMAKSPGMKYRHYAPEAYVVLVEGKSKEKVGKKIRELVKKYKREGKKVGVMIIGDDHDAHIVKLMGENLEQIAKNLFKILRELDKEGADIIIVEGVASEGLGLAIMNRLKKAASEIIKLG